MGGIGFLVLLLVLVGALVAWGVSLYNQLVKKRNHVEDGWSGVEVQLKRRYDLVPNLVQIVKKYAEHEKSTLSEVIELRNAAKAASTREDGRVEEKFSQVLSGLMLQVEAYPELKSNANFLELQKQLQKVEDDLQYARRYFNGAVREYNTLVQSFPSTLIATRYDFREAEFFELSDPKESRVPEVDL